MKTLSRHEEKIRYLLVGGWNTAFGYLLFVVLYRLLRDMLHYSVILALVYVLGISSAFLLYKLLVFRTRGNWLREYLRFYLVYGTAIVFNFALLPVFVELLKISPVISQGAIVFLTVIITYLGHKNFSFRRADNGR